MGREVIRTFDPWKDLGELIRRSADRELYDEVPFRDINGEPMNAEQVLELARQIERETCLEHGAGVLLVEERIRLARDEYAAYNALRTFAHAGIKVLYCRWHQRERRKRSCRDAARRHRTRGGRL